MELDRPPFETFKVGQFPSPSQFDVIELKYDGWWGQLVIDSGFWEIYSRTGMLKKWGKFKAAFVERTVIHGEFLFGTEWSKDRPDLYGKLACHTATILNGVSYEGATNKEMREALSAFLRAHEKEDIVSRCFVVDQYDISDGPKIWEERVVKEKFEGLIFKKSQSKWGAPMGRMKQIATMEYICMDVEASTSDRYAGWGARCIVGGLYVDGKLERRCNVPGMTDKQRKEFLQNKKKYIGRVLECTGKKVSKRGSIRHPEFIRWRDDKPPEDCTWPF